MANEKESAKLYKVRNGYSVMKGNQVIKEGTVKLTDKEYSLQSWKVEKIEEVKSTEKPVEEPEEKEIEEPEEHVEKLNVDRSVKKSRFNRAIKIPKGH